MERIAANCSASGLAGQIRVGSRVAAVLREWKATLAPRLPKSYVIVASVASWDAYWRTQEPWTLRVEIGGAIWEWANVTPIEQTERSVTFEVFSVPTVIRFAALPTRGER